jgi:hypothetical protein
MLFISGSDLDEPKGIQKMYFFRPIVCFGRKLLDALLSGWQRVDVAMVLRLIILDILILPVLLRWA